MHPLRKLSSHASRRTRLMLAASVWSGVGLVLFVVGVHWVLLAPVWWDLPTGLAALGVGWAKGTYVLARSAEANALRIENGEHRRFIGAAFPVGMWAMAVGMMALGAYLRRSHMPRFWLGLIYVAVGTALLIGSRVSWAHWRRLPRQPR
jgi:hypothetical protein